MILADTSVIIDFWRNPEKKKQEIFERNEIATCYIIRAELFHGVKSDKERRRINSYRELKVFFLRASLCLGALVAIFLK